MVVQDLAGGRVRGIATGTELGPRRTGAIGGVAADLLARPDAATLALIDPDWLAPGCFVSTLHPKQAGRAEFGPELVDAVQVAATDSLHAPIYVYYIPTYIGCASSSLPRYPPEETR
ncbi:hypothetical protein [Microlunatus parietis]|uniref:Uncharacterized protein n=1 Tax=Microlunatus parietis TaxID=682979 RepID=A0A7Y9IBL0_9ACTN|nr:hypothetical protein [Microlunatus parietis]NYE73775.1 hypothetical protein [Microlunatus parietis]